MKTKPNCDHFLLYPKCPLRSKTPLMISKISSLQIKQNQTLLQFPPKGVMVLRTGACTALLVLVYNCVCVCIPFETHVSIHM